MDLTIYFELLILTVSEVVGVLVHWESSGLEDPLAELDVTLHDTSACLEDRLEDWTYSGVVPNRHLGIGLIRSTNRISDCIDDCSTVRNIP